MIRILGAIIVIISSVTVGYMFTVNLKKRINNVQFLADIIDFISSEIEIYRMPVNDIFEKINQNSLSNSDITLHIDNGLYAACKKSGLLSEAKEDKIIIDFERKLYSDSVDDIVKNCSYTSQKLRNLSDKLSAESTEKFRLYRTISIVAGASAVIILI